MHTNEPREAPDADMGFEVRDVNISIISKVIFWFIAFDVICYAVVGVWYWAAKINISSHLDPKKPMPTIELESNVSVRADLETLRQAETATLSSYKRNDDGTYTIPIERAMKIIADRGLPHVLTSTPAVRPGNTIKQNAVQPGTAVPYTPAPGGGQ